MRTDYTASPHGIHNTTRKLRHGGAEAVETQAKIAVNFTDLCELKCSRLSSRKRLHGSQMFHYRF
jgi:hypothetical protein